MDVPGCGKRQKGGQKVQTTNPEPLTTAAVAHKNILTSCFYMDIIRDAKAGNLTKTLFIPALTLWANTLINRYLTRSVHYPFFTYYL
jgi:hypothetical protein